MILIEFFDLKVLLLAEFEKNLFNKRSSTKSGHAFDIENIVILISQLKVQFFVLQRPKLREIGELREVLTFGRQKDVLQV